jgi:hypothetical protein
MPTIANFPRSDLDPRSHPSDRVVPTQRGSHGIGLRLSVAFRHRALTERLAIGADPASSPELSLRAEQITRDRYRRRLARSLRHAITEAHESPRTRSRVVLVCRPAVREAGPELKLLIARLEDGQPVEPEGVAISEQILIDGISSPLYNATVPGALRRMAVLATAALHPGVYEPPATG